MFTGIVEKIATISHIKKDGSNMDFTIESGLKSDLYIDQSISHNGVCLTIVAIDGNKYTVTAIKETLDKTNLGSLIAGDQVNIERAVAGHTRMDGHMVQGHVDKTTSCIKVEEEAGSWRFTFELPTEDYGLLVDKGSVCINGVSLTVINPTETTFEVAIIPYTFEHTTFKFLKPDDCVNIEYDIIGKYVQRYMKNYSSVFETDTKK